MSQTKTTVGFLAGAAASVLLALVTWWATQPTPVEGFGLVGEEFFPDLKPQEATALRVIVYNPKQGDVQKPFVVEQVDGVWQLPYYYKYPADGEERLAETTTSLIGTTRRSLRSRLASDHAQFGVVDPLEQDPEILEGHGSRITLYKDGNAEKGIVIADLIIGKKITDFDKNQANVEPDKAESGEARQVADVSGDYYVRKPDEDETYIATLNIKLSTKFSDWVEDDLLKTQQDNLTNLELRSVKQTPDRKIEQITEASLARERSADPWRLSGLNEETEETNTDAIRDIVSTLDSLKLSAVRPRPRRRDGKPLLLGDLTLNIPEGVKLDAQTERDLQRDIQGNLGQSGFAIYMDSQAGKVQLYARGGELSAGEKSGVRYHLSFGDSFQGTQDEILVGGAPDASEKPEKKDSEENEDESDGEKPADGKIASRFLIVRATFDESLLGPPLVKPTRPEVPEGVKVDDEGNVIEPEPVEPTPDSSTKPVEAKPAESPATEKEKSEDESSCQEEAPSEKQDGEKPTDPEKKPAAPPAPENKPAAGDTPPPAETTEAPKPDPVEEYKSALSAFRTATIKYTQDVEDRKTKTTDGQKRVDELNYRFADWYYVITEEDYKKLRRTREDLVKAKEKPEEPATGTEGPLPEPGRDGVTKPAIDGDAKPTAPDSNEDAAPAAGSDSAATSESK